MTLQERIFSDQLRTPSDGPTAEELRELLSEAAVEIANLDSPDNPVAKRLRAALGEGGR